MTMSFVRCALLAVLALMIQVAQPSRAVAAPVLMISIDGLRADDVSKPGQHGLHIPTLRALAASGVSAASVRGVLPTITYPSHTTMITGVYPAKHGIAANATFDPEGKNMGGWMWYAQDIKVPTLWDMVKARGGTVASIGWPASVGKREIDYHIPEFWRAKVPEDEKLLRVVSTPGMPDEIERLTGVPFADVALDRDDLHSGMDDARMIWVAAIIARYKPQLTTVHLVTLDGARHKFGPYSAKARDTLERIDRGLGAMIEKARAAQPDLVVVIVSDHGFAQIDKSLNLVTALAADGLITFGADGRVANWSAFPWVTGGSAAILLKNPSDTIVEGRVRQVLAKLAADPAYGIDRILERKDIARLGGTPDAAFWVSMKSGYSIVAGAGKPLLQDATGKGTHGYSPENDDMLSAFFMSGPGIARKQLGVIDMRDIGPTIGAVLDAQLPRYDGKVIPVTTGGK
jgi:predicted AlkP superfamily pyrophosphatase or phosphodiesterase